MRDAATIVRGESGQSLQSHLAVICSIAGVRLGFVAGVVEIVFESSGAVSPDPQVSTIPLCDRFNCGRARFEHAEPEAAIRLELPATHEKAFLDDPTVPDRVKPDLIEVDAFLALWRDIQLEANDELIPVPQGGGRKNPMVEREPRSS